MANKTIIYAINNPYDFGIGYISKKASEGLLNMGHSLNLIRSDKQVQDSVFDESLRRIIIDHLQKGQKLDVLHVWANHGHKTLEYLSCTNNPPLTVLERASTHIRHQSRVLHEEYRTHIIPGNVIKRMEAEYDLADIIIVPSLQARNTFPENLRYKVRILPFGIDTDRFKPIDTKKAPGLNVGFVGCNTTRKGLRYLLEAVKQLEAGGLKINLLLAMGRVPPNKIVEFYNTLDVFCLPSLEEGNALAVNEAMACGLPVVVTEECGLWPGFDHRNGIVVKPRDVNSIKRALMRLTDREKRAEIGKRNSSWAREKDHSWETYAERLSDIYQKRVQV